LIKKLDIRLAKVSAISTKSTKEVPADVSDTLKDDGKSQVSESPSTQIKIISTT
jgi:hypothetical protein